VEQIARMHGVEAPAIGLTIEKGLEIRQRSQTLGAWDVAALESAYEQSLESRVR
jgi:hypothetical protein